MSDDPEHLAERYGALAPVVRRGGRAYPAACVALRELRVEVGSDPSVVDEGLALDGAAHLARVRERVPWMYDGEVLALDSLGDGAGGGAVLRCAPASFFMRVATCDALRAEAGDAMRARAEELAGGDPLRRGTGRAAGIGVTCVATLPRGGRRHVVLGRRAGLPIGAGTWHVVPAGMAEGSGPGALEETARRELEEELGVVVARGGDGGRAASVRAGARGYGRGGEGPGAAGSTHGGGSGNMRLLGVGFDLLRLVPEVVYRCDLDEDADAILLRAPDDEHDVLQLHAIDDDGHVPTAWAAHPPHKLAAPGAAALALLEGGA